MDFRSFGGIAILCIGVFVVFRAIAGWRRKTVKRYFDKEVKRNHNPFIYYSGVITQLIYGIAAIACACAILLHK